MKAIFFLVLIALITVSTCTGHLRAQEQHQSLPFLNSLNPLQIASLLSGDIASVLPASIQPIVRSVLGQQQQSGVSGFLSKAQSLLGGGNTGGLLGGMGNLFGQSAQQGQNGLGNFLGTISNAFGGSNNGIASSLGLPSIPGLSALSGLTNTGSSSAASGFQGILNTLTGK